MSSHVVASSGLGDHVAIGWDAERRTFFAHVHDGGVGDFPVYSIGSTPGEIPTLAAFLRRVRSLALIDDATAARLERDRTTEGTRELIC